MFLDHLNEQKVLPGYIFLFSTVSSKSARAEHKEKSRKSTGGRRKKDTGNIHIRNDVI